VIITKLPGMNFEDYDEITGEIYAAAQEPARWPEVVRRIAIGCESPRALLLTPLHSVDQGGFGYAFNLSPVALSIYRGPSDPDFGEADLDRVRRLVVHLARALSLTLHLIPFHTTHNA